MTLKRHLYEAEYIMYLITIKHACTLNFILLIIHYNTGGDTSH